MDRTGGDGGMIGWNDLTDFGQEVVAGIVLLIVALLAI
jgi:hypothetical protein